MFWRRYVRWLSSPRWAARLPPEIIRKCIQKSLQSCSLFPPSVSSLLPPCLCYFSCARSRRCCAAASLAFFFLPPSASSVRRLLIGDAGVPC